MVVSLDEPIGFDKDGKWHPEKALKNAVVTALAVGTTKITASCDSLTAVSFDMKVYSKNTGLSSNSPLSGEEARDFYNDGVYDSTKSYYVGGYVSKIDGSN